MKENINEIEENRRMLEGSLNRMQITHDIAKVNKRASDLIYYLSQHISLNKARILQSVEIRDEKYDVN